MANLVFNMGREHPLRPGVTLISWDLILVMEPSTILGALVGGYLNKVWGLGSAFVYMLCAGGWGAVGGG